jgi:hypothetical protein
MNDSDSDVEVVPSPSSPVAKKAKPSFVLPKVVDGDTLYQLAHYVKAKGLPNPLWTCPCCSVTGRGGSRLFEHCEKHRFVTGFRPVLEAALAKHGRRNKQQDKDRAQEEDLLSQSSYLSGLTLESTRGSSSTPSVQEWLGISPINEIIDKCCIAVIEGA